MIYSFYLPEKLTMKRIYKEGQPHHVFSKGVDGNIIYYTIADCLYYTTLYSCYAKKYEIRTLSFSLMPNHIHSLQCATTENDFLRFNQELISHFTTAYNRQHDRSGALFQKPFGSAPKIVGKQIRSCFSYINNNASVGGLSKSILDYRWNLIAYLKDTNPFSSRISLDRASTSLRRSLKLVDFYHSSQTPLEYEALDIVFSKLSQKEKSVVIDYILSRYEVLDGNGLDEYFGSFSKAMTAMEANSGSEHDIKEDWENYSEYSELSRIAKEEDICLDRVNFESMPTEEKIRLANTMLSRSGATKRQIQKFLHFKSGD